MLFLFSPSRCDVFIFMASAHLDKGVESISEFGIPTVQILLPPPPVTGLSGIVVAQWLTPCCWDGPLIKYSR